MSFPNWIYDIRNRDTDPTKAIEISGIGMYEDFNLSILKGHDPSSHKYFISIQSTSAQTGVSSIEISSIETIFLLKRALDKALEFGWIK